MKTNIEEDKINSFIYWQINSKEPTRYEMIRYSTWRIYLYNELQAIPIQRGEVKKNPSKSYTMLFPNLISSSQKKDFYNFISNPGVRKNQNYQDAMRMENISHYVCRMLYCQEETNHQTFLSMEKRILESKLWRQLPENNVYYRKNLMNLMKKILNRLRSIDPEYESQSFNISLDEWQKLGSQIHFYSPQYMEKMQQFAKLPFQFAEYGIRKRRSFISKGFVYVPLESMMQIVLSNYEFYLKKKLQKTRPIVTDLIVDDVQNQLSSFLLKTIKQINEEGMDETKFNGKFNLTLRNIDALGQKYFPPCMLNLNQNLKVNRHLRHEGRRQLWGFFKACGMDVHDNKEYFRKHFEGKVTASQMKSHLYNIEHSYGMQGKRKVQNAWVCRNIISGTAPKKGEHHGCPFYHWRSEQLGQFLRKNYKIGEEKLRQVLKQKEDKHFQVACGRLFEYSEVNKLGGNIPVEITGKLGKAPYLYYEAAMQLRESKIKKEEGKESIDF